MAAGFVLEGSLGLPFERSSSILVGWLGSYVLLLIPNYVVEPWLTRMKRIEGA